MRLGQAAAITAYAKTGHSQGPTLSDCSVSGNSIVVNFQSSDMIDTIAPIPPGSETTMMQVLVNASEWCECASPPPTAAHSHSRTQHTHTHTHTHTHAHTHLHHHSLHLQVCRTWATSARTTGRGTTQVSSSRRLTMTRPFGWTLTFRSRRPQPSRSTSPTQRVWPLVSGSCHMLNPRHPSVSCLIHI
jgi:hypothetical protein